MSSSPSSSSSSTGASISLRISSSVSSSNGASSLLELRPRACVLLPPANRLGRAAQRARRVGSVHGGGCGHRGAIYEHTRTGCRVNRREPPRTTGKRDQNMGLFVNRGAEHGGNGAASGGREEIVLPGLLENGGGLDERGGELGGADVAGLAALRGLRRFPREDD